MWSRGIVENKIGERLKEKRKKAVLVSPSSLAIHIMLHRAVTTSSDSDDVAHANETLSIISDSRVADPINAIQFL